MKAITEDIIRTELKTSRPEVYYIPEGKILTPAAREYLNQQQIGIDLEKNRKAETKQAEPKGEACVYENQKIMEPKAKYIDHENGAFFSEKPEYMTQIYGNRLVNKNDPMIKFRGKLDKVQAEVVFAQAMISSGNSSEALLNDLNDVLATLREMMRCEVMNEPFANDTIIGLNHEELRAQSHNPMKYHNVKQMLLPDYSMGTAYSLINLIRTSVRETELFAVDAFMDNKKCVRTDIIEGLNRLSSAMHIMMCKQLAGEY